MQTPEDKDLQTPEDKMAAQLSRWSSKIDRLAEKHLVPGSRASLDNLMHLDELKALRAIAQSKFDEFRVSPEQDRAQLEVETKSAFSELDVALTNPMPPRRSVKPASEAES